MAPDQPLEQQEQQAEGVLQGEVESARLEQCEQLLADQQAVRLAAGERLELARQRQQQWLQRGGQGVTGNWLMGYQRFLSQLDTAMAQQHLRNILAYLETFQPK